MPAPSARIILHGRHAQDEVLRAAVERLREQGHALDVRVTWEAGDGRVLAAEAARAGAARVLAAGGDGTLNAVVNGILDADTGATLGVLPMGTANDFAVSAGVPLDLEPALRLALTAEAHPIDLGCMNQSHFVNVATAGVGAEITVATDPALKQHLGAAAYLLTGVSNLSAVRSISARVSGPSVSWEGALLGLAVGNGRQAGGGHALCPDARIDDGQLDVAILPDNGDGPTALMLRALMAGGITAVEDAMLRFRATHLEVQAPEGLTLNLDGEPSRSQAFRFDVVPRALPVALPLGCPLLGRSFNLSESPAP